MAGAEKSEITVKDEPALSLSSFALRRLGKFDLSRDVDSREVPFQLSPWENKLVVDGLRALLQDRWFPEYEKALARGLLSTNGWKY
ncbi:MAG TPA: hypothetical protein VFP35_02920 [Candidatus Saccharimonadales bacterium]|nr:hypothetical protein [Candidatus Saccharimonadales bacterium]